MARASNLRNIRVDDDIWNPAGDRAAGENTDLSKLIRGWLEEYIAGGNVQPSGTRRKVRATAAERQRAAAAVAELLADPGRLVSVALDAIDEGR